MSVWIRTIDRMPPLGEEVLILYKSKEDKLSEDNLYYAVASRVLPRTFSSSSPGIETWSYFVSYQGYYEVVYWTPLVYKPRIKN